MSAATASVAADTQESTRSARIWFLTSPQRLPGAQSLVNPSVVEFQSELHQSREIVLRLRKLAEGRTGESGIRRIADWRIGQVEALGAELKFVALRDLGLFDKCQVQLWFGGVVDAARKARRIV